jgi:hypothetical protein
MSAAPQVIRKISSRHVIANVKYYVPKADKDGNVSKDVIPLYRVFGQASNVRRGESDNGPFAALVGRFEAVVVAADPETGEVDGAAFTAPECFLPEPINSMVADELARKDANGKREVESLEFAFEVGIKASPSSSVGYEYTCTPLIERSGADPLAAMRAKVAALPPPKVKAALPAPATGTASKGKK